MGTWLAKLAGHKDDAAKVLKEPDAIAAYTLVFGLALLVLLLWIAIIIVTAIRVYKKYIRQWRNEERNIKTTLDLQVRKKIISNLRRRVSKNALQATEFEMVELATTAGPASQRLKSTKLGIKLKGGEGTNYIHGDPGIFVTNVRPGSIADGKLFPGDRIVMINDFHMGKVSLKYAREVMEALRQAEGRLKFCIKRAPLREVIYLNCVCKLL